MRFFRNLLSIILILSLISCSTNIRTSPSNNYKKLNKEEILKLYAGSTVEDIVTVIYYGLNNKYVWIRYETRVVDYQGFDSNFKFKKFIKSYLVGEWSVKTSTEGSRIYHAICRKPESRYFEIGKKYDVLLDYGCDEVIVHNGKYYEVLVSSHPITFTKGPELIKKIMRNTSNGNDKIIKAFEKLTGGMP